MTGSRVLIAGTGARKHALARRLAEEGCQQLWIAPGNPALDSMPVRTAPAGPESGRALAAWASSVAIDLAIVLDESLLFQGLADEFRDQGVTCLGPGLAPALIERSKIFAKNTMQRAGVRTPNWTVYGSTAMAWDECPRMQFPAVFKTDGPPKNKSVFIVHDVREARWALRWLARYEIGSAPVLAESFVTGPEFSVTVLVDEHCHLTALPLVHEYRQVSAVRSDMTRGMGAFAPFCIDERNYEEVLDSIGQVLQELRRSGLRYTGSLTANVILGPRGPELLEFNCHLGDPETQTALPVISESLLDIFSAAANGGLSGCADLHRAASASSVSLTMVREGYPGPALRDVLLPAALAGSPNVLFYETSRAGRDFAPLRGRALSCNASGASFGDAARQVQAVAAHVAEQVPGLIFRPDIGTSDDAMTTYARLTTKAPH
jgi:phosphoribosylamine--glycine ligase